MPKPGYGKRRKIIYELIVFINKSQSLTLSIASKNKIIIVVVVNIIVVVATPKYYYLTS